MNTEEKTTTTTEEDVILTEDQIKAQAEFVAIMNEAQNKLKEAITLRESGRLHPDGSSVLAFWGMAQGVKEGKLSKVGETGEAAGSYHGLVCMEKNTDLSALFMNAFDGKPHILMAAKKAVDRSVQRMMKGSGFFGLLTALLLATEKEK